jgi:hypothetical protein
MRVRSFARRPVRPAWYRPALERLENRLAPAGTNPFPALASQLNSALTAGFGTVVQDVQQVQAVLPILGQSLAQQATTVQNAVNSLRTTVNTAINALDPAATKATVLQRLLATGVFRSLDAPVYDPADGNVTFTAHFGKHVTLASTGFQFNLGLPGVPFSLSTQLSVALDVDYGDVSFGVQGGSFFLQAPAGGPGALTVQLTAGAANLRFAGTIGFFKVAGSPIPGVAPIQLGVGLALTANGVSFSNPHLTGNAQVNLHLDGTLTTGPNGVTFPHLATDFLMNWDLGGSSDVSARANLGSAPTVEFRNVQFGLGSFLGSMVKPIANLVDQLTAPLAPVYALLQTPLPGLSNLVQAVGLGPITLDTLAAAAVNLQVLPPDYQLLANLGLRLHTLVELIRSANFGPKNDALIPVGSFDLSQSGDLRTSTLTGGFQTLADWIKNGANLEDLSSLVPYALDAASSVEDRIKNNLASLNLPGVVQNQVSQVFNQIDEELRTAANGVGLTFPLLDDPLSIYKLLLGQDVNFIQFDFQFHGHATETKQIPVWGPVEAGFSGAIDFDLALHAGVDTYGLREFFISVIKGNSDLSTLDDGFYVNASVPLVSINGSISVNAGPKFPFGVPDGPELYADATFKGSIQTNGPLTVGLVDPNLRGDHLLRPLKSGEVRGPLFQVQGKITANLSFSVNVGVDVAGEVIGSVTVFSLSLAQAVVFDTAKQVHTANPLSQALPVDRTIDVVFDAHLFDDAPNVDVLDAEAENGNLTITYNGAVRATYALASIRSVTIFGSDENTLFFVRGDFDGSGPVQVNGGTGSNVLTFDDSAYNGSAAPYYSVHGSHLERDGLLHFAGVPILVPTTRIDFQGMQAVNVDGSTGRKDSFYLYGLSVPTTVFGGNQGNEFDLGGPSHDLSDIASNLTMFGGNGADYLVVVDDSTPRPTSYTVSHYALDRKERYQFNAPSLPSGSSYDVFNQHISYHGIESVKIEGGADGNLFAVNDVPNVNDASPTALTVELDTGKGADNVTVAASTGPVLIHGQGGNDVVNVGVAQRGTLDVSARVYVDDSPTTATLARRSYATVNVNDADDSTQRTVTFDKTVDGLGTIDGFVGTHTYPNPFAPLQSTTTVAYKISDVQAVNVQSGNDVNTFNVLNTPRRTAPVGLGLVNGISTHLTLGTYINTVNVWGTTGPLSITGASTLNDVYLGGNSAARGNLGNLRGAVTLVGTLDFVSLQDAQPHGFRYYTMSADGFAGGATAGITYSNLILNRLDVALADGGNQLITNGTPTVTNNDNSGIYVFTGDGSDFVDVNGTDADLHLDLGKGFFQSVAIGSSTASLDAIGNVNVAGSGTIDAFVSDAAATTGQSFSISTFGGDGQRVLRTQANGDSLNSFIFDFEDRGTLAFTAGKGGDSVELDGTPAQATTLLYGGAGEDTFVLATDDSLPILGPVYVYGTAAQDDQAFLYTKNPGATAQSYTFQATASKPVSQPTVLDQQVVQRPGNAPVTFKGFASLTTRLPSVGGNQVTIQGVPAGEALNLVTADHDRVAVGNGTLAQVRGPVSIESGQYVSVTLDDSVDAVARSVVLHPPQGDGGDFIAGLAPAPVYLPSENGDTVTLLGGKGNDTFALAGLGFDAAIRIDGGKGVNTLDYSQITSQPGAPAIDVDLAAGTATGLDGGIADIQKVKGLPPPGP